MFTALVEARVVLGVTDFLEGKTLPNSAVHQILKRLIIFMEYSSKLSHQNFHNYLDPSKEIK